MKKTTLCLALLSAACATTLTSCLDDNNGNNEKYTMQSTYDGNFSSIKDLETNETYNCAGTVYKFYLEIADQAKMDVTINNFRLGPDDVPTSITIPNLKLTVNNDGAYVGSAQDVQFYIGNQPHLMDNISVVYRDRVVNGNYRMVAAVDYTIDSQYQVTVIPTTAYFFGTMTSTDDASGTSFSKKNVPVTVTFKPASGTADLAISGARFSEAMPRDMDMTFPGLTFKVTQTGYILEASEIIPTINNDPFPAYPIKNLNLTANNATGTMSGNFECTPGSLGLYRCSFDLKAVPDTTN